ncbi:MAG: TonB-dependent receptor [Proteobacteria bacterium]|nr:TonB-dependent receptor [Pseudomonadota bacterium]
MQSLPYLLAAAVTTTLAAAASSANFHLRRRWPAAAAATSGPARPLRTRRRTIAPLLAALCWIVLLPAPRSAWAQDLEDLGVLPADDSGEVGLGSLLDVIDVVVTATKKEQSVEQAPSIVSVIKAGELRENGYRSLADALRQVPGIYVRDDLIHPNIAMRGIDAGLRAWSRSIKVMINGQPIAYRGDTANWLGPELLPMEAVSRVEVVRGPSSTLYGANAFLGVVNVITRSGYRRNWATATVESGVAAAACADVNRRARAGEQVTDLCATAKTPLNPSLTSNLAIGHHLELTRRTTLDFLASAAVGYADRSGLMLPSTSPHFATSGPRYFDGSAESVSSKDDRDLWGSAFGQLSLTNESWGTLRLEGHYNEFARNGEFTDWGVLTHENRVGMRNWYVRLGHDRRLRVLPLTYRLQVSLAGGGHTGANHLQIAQGNPFWVEKVGGYLGYDLNGEVTFDLTPALTLIAGTTLTQDFHDLPSIYSVEGGAAGAASVKLPSYVLGDVDFVNFAAFGQVLWTPVESLSLIAGTSFEQHNVYGRCTFSSCPGLNARLGASYSLIRRSELSLYSKLLYGSSFKAPPAELLYGTPYVLSGISGNLRLDPEVAHTFEAALGSGILLFERELRLDVLVNGFLNLVNGKVEYVQAGNFTRAENSSDLRTIGVESGLRARLREQLSAYLNFSWQQTATRACLLADVSLCQRQAEMNPLYPTTLLSFGAAYRLPALKLRASLYGAYVARRWASQANRAENVPFAGGGGFDSKAYRLPSYLLLNLVLSTPSLSWGPLRRTAFSVGAYNLLNSGLVEPGFGGIDTPGLGLTALASVRQRF